MKLSHCVVALAALLISLARADFLSSRQQYCVTKSGPLFVWPILTQTSTTVIQHTVTHTTTVAPTVTTTPTSVVSSTTVSITSATAPQFTSTFFSTVESTALKDVLETVVSVVTNTVTVSTTTSATITATPSPNFIPIASAAAVVNNGGGRKRSDALLGRAFGWNPGRPFGIANGGGSTSPANRHIAPGVQPFDFFAQSVVCWVYKDEIVPTQLTVTAGATSVITALATTVTSLETVILTRTIIPPDAQTTITTTEVETSTVTSTTTELSTASTTSTTTSIVALATVWPQCLTDNIISQVGGQPLYTLDASNDYGIIDNVATPQDCCQLCQSLDQCGGFGWYSPSEGGQCEIVYNTGTCSATQVDFEFWTGGDGSDPTFVGNSNCGQGSYETS